MKSYLSARSLQFGGTPIHLGTGSSQYRWKSDGCCGNVDLHPNCVCSICAVPGNRIFEVEEESD